MAANSTILYKFLDMEIEETPDCDTDFVRVSRLTFLIRTNIKYPYWHIIGFTCKLSFVVGQKKTNTVCLPYIAALCSSLVWLHPRNVYLLFAFGEEKKKKRTEKADFLATKL